jgi:hypothetical protein
MTQSAWNYGFNLNSRNWSWFSGDEVFEGEKATARRGLKKTPPFYFSINFPLFIFFFNLILAESLSKSDF